MKNQSSPLPNALECYLFATGRSEREAMNALQLHGVISDNCVTAADVADSDCDRAIAFLSSTRPSQRGEYWPSQFQLLETGAGLRR